MSKKIKNNGIFYVAISLFVALSIMFTGLSILMAYSVSTTQNIETYNFFEAQEPVIEEVTLGAFPGGDIYNPVFFHDTVVQGLVGSSLSLRATTTRNIYDTTISRDAIGWYTNGTGKDLLCDGDTLAVYFATAFLDDIAGELRVGTTTPTGGGSWTNTSTATLFASTTIATTDTFANNQTKFQASTNYGSYFSQSDLGRSSTTLFLLKNGESILANMDVWNATNTEEYTQNNMTGSFGVECWNVKR